MVTILIEGIIGIVLFTLMVLSAMYANPLNMIHDYPPAIQNKAKELGLIKDEQKGYSKADIIRKGVAVIVIGVVMAFVVHRFNGADTFVKGFLYSYLLWNIVNWWDAIVIDCIWFCHSKRAVIPGTEGMKEYKDYMFHIKGSCIGMLLGLPACVIVGILVLIF